MAGAAFGRLHEAPPFAPFSNMSYMMQRLSVTVVTDRELDSSSVQG